MNGESGGVIFVGSVVVEDVGFSVLVGFVVTFGISGAVTSIPTSATVGSEVLVMGELISVGVWVVVVFDSAIDEDFRGEVGRFFFFEKESLFFAFDK